MSSCTHQPSPAGLTLSTGLVRGKSFTSASNHTIFFEAPKSPLQTLPSLHEPNRMYKLPVLVSSIALHQMASLTGSVSPALACPPCLLTHHSRPHRHALPHLRYGFPAPPSQAYPNRMSSEADGFF